MDWSLLPLLRNHFTCYDDGTQVTFPQKPSVAVFTDQILRHVGSIGANIAEGFNRSKKKYLDSLEIALGEAKHAENWLYKLRDGCFTEAESTNARIRECVEIAKMLNALIRSIERKAGTYHRSLSSYHLASMT